MSTRVRSYSKINLGLAIGPPREDGFHGLTTLYQTLGLHDMVTVTARRLEPGTATRIALTTDHPFVPRDSRNTAWKMAERALSLAGIAAKVEIHIDKRLPVQGGMGAGSANAAATLLGLERELDLSLDPAARLRLAAGVGSDVPLFLLGGTVLGTGRGEQVLPLPDLPQFHCVIAVPGLGVSTPQAFRDWDARLIAQSQSQSGGLTFAQASDRLNELSCAYASCYAPSGSAEPGTSGIVSDLKAKPLNDLAGNSLLALVRTGIENDFEQVVFPQYPSLREIKRQLMGSDSEHDSGGTALYAALSGSGSVVFGLYRCQADAIAAQQRVRATGVQAPGVETILTETLPREQYWTTMFAG